MQSVFFNIIELRKQLRYSILQQYTFRGSNFAMKTENKDAMPVLKLENNMNFI
jgi:hypothetical protein